MEGNPRDTHKDGLSLPSPPYEKNDQLVVVKLRFCGGIKQLGGYLIGEINFRSGREREPVYKHARKQE